MITAEATAPERIKLGFSGPEWEKLRDRIDFGQRAGEIALGHHVVRHAGDTYGAFINDEVVHDGPNEDVHYIEWSLPMIQLLRMRLLYAMMEDNARLGRLMHQVPHDDPDNLLYDALWKAEDELKTAYRNSEGEEYPQPMPKVISYLEGGY
ncbi:MAG: hypothetical protein ACHQT5_00570 [Candidatus Saccharimonadales bacterium]|jgi:hypothetical protein